MMDQSSVQIIALAGELDVSRGDEVMERLSAPTTAKSILLDLSEVTYADSTVIAALFAFREQAERERQRIAVLIESPQLVRLLQYAGLQEAFPIFLERSEALSHLVST